MKKYLTRDKDKNGSYVYANTWEDAEAIAGLLDLGKVEGMLVRRFKAKSEMDDFLAKLE